MKLDTTSDIAKLIVPDHVRWSFNGELFAQIDNTTRDFKFEYILDSNENTEPDIKKAVQNALTRLHDISGMTLAICVGGADSEIIAREAAAINIPFEIYFLNLWDTNAKSMEKVVMLGNELGVKVNIVYLSKEDAYNNVLPNNYMSLQAEKPTYMCLPYLFSKIPETMYIVGGEGDPQKSGKDYEPYTDEDGRYPGLPISATEVFYRQWALENQRASEMYFYASTQELIKSYYYHPLLKNSDMCINTRELVDAVWPTLIFSYKTTNWEDNPNANYDVRMHVREINSDGRFNVTPSICMVKI